MTTALRPADGGRANAPQGGTVVLVAHDLVVRSFLSTGALDRVLGPDTWLVASSDGIAHPEWRALLENHPRYLGTVRDPRPEVERGTHLLSLDYRFLRRLFTVAGARRSSTMGIKLRFMAPRKRRLFRLAALPGVRSLLTWAVMRRTGLNPDVEALFERMRPDLVIIPTGVYDTLAWDALRSTRRRGIPTLAVIPNWDALSGKTGFPVRPDRLAVWGEQTAEHARRIHGFPAERISLVGAPQFESYVRHEPGTAESPFAFPYVLFAGTSAPFDELSPLRELDRLVARDAPELRIVYRPHPDRKRRKRDDTVDESTFRSVVLDPQVRERYLQRARGAPGSAGPFFPPLDYYLGLLDNAAFVVCAFSTMIIEAALLGKHVLVPAWHDGIHRDSPATVRGYEHFKGLERLEGVTLCDSPEELAERFAALARERPGPSEATREQARWFVHFDGRPFAERLADAVHATRRQTVRKRPPSRRGG